MPSFAIISDLHCHPSDCQPNASWFHSDSPRTPNANHPIQALIDLIRKQSLRVDAVLAPGDLTDKANNQGLMTAFAAVKEVASELKTEIVAFTVGNHDVDPHNLHGSDAFALPQNFHPEFPVTANAEKDRFWTRGFYSLTTPDIFILALNSVQSHHSLDDAKRGEISEKNLQEIRQTLDVTNQKYKIAVVHHHPIQHEDMNLGSEDLLVRGSLLLELLAEHEFHLIVHGHKHYPRLKLSQEPCLPVLAAGSVSAIAPMNTRNTFHIVHLDDEVPYNCVRPGRIETWVFGLTRGWMRVQGSVADFPRLTGFGFRGNIEELANNVVSTLDGNNILKWESLRVKHPQIAYLTPAQEKEFEQFLKNQGYILFESREGERVFGELH